ncbi:MAG: N-acyl homoserine lactone hydrolase [Labilithrix sp.]|nr:N-acyl homoserine lactone hydrolase [Labilithrix sp.]
MKNLGRRIVVASLAVAAAACGSMGTHDLRALEAAPAPVPTRTWEEVFAHPAALHVTAFNTGEVLVGTSIVIEDGPRVPEPLRHDRWVPALAYLVEHPTAGRMLFDTGVPASDAKGRCDFGRWPLWNVPCRSAPDQTAIAQLAARGVAPTDLRFIVMSHFHGDHAGGLHALVKDHAVPVLTTAEEWADVNRTFPSLHGYLTEVLDGSYPVRTLPPARAVMMPIVGRVFDLLGDGSVWILPAAGHTRGEIAALLNAEGGPVLLTFDSSHLAASVDLEIPPGFVVDRDAAVATIRRLRALRDAYPQIRFVYGHDPEQWAGKPRAVPLVP